MDAFMLNRAAVVAAVAVIIFLAGAGIAVSSLMAGGADDIDHAMWVTWVIVIPSFIVFCVAGVLAVLHHRREP
jgi:predicted Na+-dependent transporter